MSKVIRIIHDTYRDILNFMRIPLIDEERLMPMEVVHIQKRGHALVNLDWEEEFYGCSVSRRELAWKDTYYFKLKEPYILGNDAHIFSKRRRVYPFSIRINARHKVRRPIPFLSIPLNNTVFDLCGRSQNNRAHFLFENIPRLYCFQKFFSLQSIKILVVSRQKTWQREYLRLFYGIQNNQIIEGSPGTMQVPLLHYVQPLCDDLSSPDRSSLGDINVLRNMFYDLSEITGRIIHTNQFFKTVWISRDDARQRRLLNEDELIASWRQTFGGIRKICLSNHSLQDQLRVLKNSCCIIAPQGQGCHLFPFFKDKINIILEPGEPNTRLTWDNIFVLVSELGKNKALRLFSKTPPLKKGDWIFPVDVFEENLKKIKKLTKCWSGRLEAAAQLYEQ